MLLQRPALLSPRCELRFSAPCRNLAQLSTICWLTSLNLESSRVDVAASSTAPPGPAAAKMPFTFSLVSAISFSRAVFNSDSNACSCTEPQRLHQVTTTSVRVILGPKCTLAASRRVLPLVSHVEYAPLAVLRLEKKTPRTLLRLGKNGTDRRKDGRTPYRSIALTARRGQCNKKDRKRLTPLKYTS